MDISALNNPGIDVTSPLFTQSKSGGPRDPLMSAAVVSEVKGLKETGRPEERKTSQDVSLVQRQAQANYDIRKAQRELQSLQLYAVINPKAAAEAAERILKRIDQAMAQLASNSPLPQGTSQGPDTAKAAAQSVRSEAEAASSQFTSQAASTSALEAEEQRAAILNALRDEQRVNVDRPINKNDAEQAARVARQATEQAEALIEANAQEKIERREDASRLADRIRQRSALIEAGLPDLASPPPSTRLDVRA